MITLRSRKEPLQSHSLVPSPRQEANDYGAGMPRTLMVACHWEAKGPAALSLPCRSNHASYPDLPDAAPRSAVTSGQAHPQLLVSCYWGHSNAGPRSLRCSLFGSGAGLARRQRLGHLRRSRVAAKCAEPVGQPDRRRPTGADQLLEQQFQ